MPVSVAGDRPRARRASDRCDRARTPHSRPGHDRTSAAPDAPPGGRVCYPVGRRAVEQFGILMLDSKNRVLRIKLLSVGSLNSTVVHPREVFREAAAAAAAAIILFHNHPSGDPSPSPDDIELTGEDVGRRRDHGHRCHRPSHPGRPDLLLDDGVGAHSTAKVGLSGYRSTACEGPVLRLLCRCGWRHGPRRADRCWREAGGRPPGARQPGDFAGHGLDRAGHADLHHGHEVLRQGRARAAGPRARR